LQDKCVIDYNLYTQQATNIKFQQGNTNISEIEITLYEKDGDKANITGEEIEFRFIKPGGLKVFQDFEHGVKIVDPLKGVVNCRLLNEVLQVTGLGQCEVYRKLGDEELTMPSFNFIVNGTIGAGSLSTNYISSIESKIVEWQSQVNALLTKDFTGATGLAGTNGINGTNGVDGKDGAIGITGEQGIPRITGAIGATGSIGVTGATGRIGLTGKDGETYDDSAIKVSLANILQQVNIKSIQFGAKGGGIIDDTLAIKNAIAYLASIGGGSLIFPHDTYLISSTINVPVGVSIDFNFSTIKCLTNAFTNNFMFSINSINCSTWDIAYSMPHSGYFKNINLSNPNNILNVKGVFVACSYNLYNISTTKLYQSIVGISQYLDEFSLEKIFIDQPQGTLYQIYKVINGESLTIKDVFVNVYDITVLYGLTIYIQGCNGGKISNVINGGIYIKDSSALKLQGLHLERGQLTLVNSFVSMDGIYFHHTNKWTPIVINNPANGSLNCGLSRPIEINNLDIEYRINEVDFDESFPDISISSFAFVKINNAFRKAQNLGMTFTSFTGIAILFNGITHKNIYSCAIIKNNELTTYDNNFVKNYGLYDAGQLINLTEDATIPCYVTKGQIYYYRLISLIDTLRCIGSIISAEQSATMNNNGFKLNIRDSLVGYFTRLYRGITTGVYTQYVDIPIRINNYLFDSGNNVNGYKWITLATALLSSDLSILNNTTITEVRTDSSLVYCRGIAIPTKGTWVVGDKIMNIVPAGGGYEGWVCITAGTPGTWKGFGLIDVAKLGTQTDSTATDVTTLKTDFNALLAKLKTAGLM